MADASSSSESGLSHDIDRRKIPLDTASPLGQKLMDKIVSSPTGEIRWRDFMELSLYDPEEGYYAKNVEFISWFTGERKSGDFSTYPEKANFFGESVGRALSTTWKAMGEPSTFEIVELGPGRGRLAEVILSWAQKNEPAFYDSLQYTLVEKSDRLQQMQQARLARFNVGNENKIQWEEGNALGFDKSHIKGAIISNELFDALAVDIVKKKDGSFLQLKLTSDQQGNIIERWSATVDEDLMDYIDKYYHGGTDFAEEQEEPINVYASQLQTQLAQKLDRGIMIHFDYGQNGNVGKVKERPTYYYGTVNGRMIGHDHDPDLPYEAPGKLDITSLVNYEMLTNVSRLSGLEVLFAGLQAKFLAAFGMDTSLKQYQSEWLSGKTLHAMTTYNNEIFHARRALDDNPFFAFVVTKGIPSEMRSNFPDIYGADITSRIYSTPKLVFKLPLSAHQNIILRDTHLPGRDIMIEQYDPDKGVILDLQTLLGGRFFVDELGNVLLGGDEIINEAKKKLGVDSLSYDQKLEAVIAKADRAI